MAIEKLFPEDPEKRDQKKIHKPEIIFQDEDMEQAQLKADMNAVKIRSSLVLRFLMLLVFLVGILTLAFNLLVLVAHTILIIATFLKSPVFIEVWRRTIKAVKRWSAISIGSFLAIFFPGIGITFMLSYFFVSSDKESQNAFNRLFREHLERGNGRGGPGSLWS
jgi:cell division protein FtsW (lipid II flippase)